MDNWVGISIVVGQGAIVAAIIYGCRSFGAYTSVVLQTHQQNMLIQQENFNLSDDLARLRAQVLAERAERDRRCRKPLQSEEVAS
jgi:hypothetical protein